MLRLGIVCIVAAIALIVFGVVNAAVHALLWVGVVVAIIALVLIVTSRSRGRADRL